MGQVLDIVPNHMSASSNDNHWWRDVLENGPASPYAGFFDIAWEASLRVEMHGKVLLPVLGKSYGDALESQEIQLAHVAGAFLLRYFDHGYPVAPQSYVMILEHRHDELTALLAEDHESLAEYDSIMTAIRHLAPPNETDPAKVAERQREKEVIKRRLATLTDKQPAVREFIERNVVLFNGTPGDPHSFDRLDALLQELQSRLAATRDDRLALVQELLTNKEDGRIELYVTHWRSTAAGGTLSYAVGEYVPAQVLGTKRGAHILVQPSSW